MHSQRQSEDTSLNTEEQLVSKLLKISYDNNVSGTEYSVCLGCGKCQNPFAFQRDLKRWTDRLEVYSFNDLWHGRSFCDCKNESDHHSKNQNFKFRKRQMMENPKITRSHSTSVKDFISHNKLLCNGFRNKHSLSEQAIHNFMHHKNKSTYIDNYRRNKLKKLEEQSCFQLDQSYFDNELFTSLSKSLSSIITEKPNDPQPSVNHIDSLGQHIQSRLKVDSQKCMTPHSGQQNDSGLSLQRSKYLNDICVRCSDNVKNTSRQITNTLQQENNSATRVSGQDKPEEKRFKKLSKRLSDQRPKLTAEKNPFDLPKPTIETATSSSLQPVCHQIPIRSSTFTEKNFPLKRDEWRGHPTSVKPTFSERPGKGTDGRRKQDGSFVGKTLEYSNVFNTYGDKCNVLKESI